MTDKITNLVNYFICLLIIYWFQSLLDKNYVRSVWMTWTFILLILSLGATNFSKYHRGWSLFMTGVETYSFIGREGIIWDLGGNFRKFIDRGNHRGTWIECYYMSMLELKFKEHTFCDCRSPCNVLSCFLKKCVFLMFAKV